MESKVFITVDLASEGINLRNTNGRISQFIERSAITVPVMTHNVEPGRSTDADLGTISRIDIDVDHGTQRDIVILLIIPELGQIIQEDDFMLHHLTVSCTM
jgi:hypothetical protein